MRRRQSAKNALYGRERCRPRIKNRQAEEIERDTEEEEYAAVNCPHQRVVGGFACIARRGISDVWGHTGALQEIRQLSRNAESLQLSVCRRRNSPYICCELGDSMNDSCLSCRSLIIVYHMNVANVDSFCAASDYLLALCSFTDTYALSTSMLWMGRLFRCGFSGRRKQSRRNRLRPSFNLTNVAITGHCDGGHRLRLTMYVHSLISIACEDRRIIVTRANAHVAQYLIMASASISGKSA